MRLRWIVAALAMLSGSPAAADITARYVSPMNNAVALTVEINDKGNSRLSLGNQMAILTLDGVSYILTSDLSGAFAVRQDDFMAAQIDAVQGAKPSQPSAIPERVYEIVPGGSETVGGRTGSLWTVRSKDLPAHATRSASPGFDFVVSTDPDLAPIGHVLAAQFGASVSAMGQMLGSTPDFATKIAAVFAKGTVIRMSRLMRLDSVDTSPVPAAEFDLPGPLLTREQFAARSAQAPQP